MPPELRQYEEACFMAFVLFFGQFATLVSDFRSMPLVFRAFDMAALPGRSKHTRMVSDVVYRELPRLQK